MLAYGWIINQYGLTPASISYFMWKRVNVVMLKLIFQSVLANFNKVHSTTFKLCDIEMIFGKTLSTVPLPCNFTCILYAKYYLYNRKCNKKELDLHEFLCKRNYKYCIEELVYIYSAL